MVSAALYSSAVSAYWSSFPTLNRCQLFPFSHWQINGPQLCGKPPVRLIRRNTPPASTFLASHKATRSHCAFVKLSFFIQLFPSISLPPDWLRIASAAATSVTRGSCRDEHCYESASVRSGGGGPNWKGSSSRCTENIVVIVVVVSATWWAEQTPHEPGHSSSFSLFSAFLSSTLHHFPSACRSSCIWHFPLCWPIFSATVVINELSCSRQLFSSPTLYEQRVVRFVIYLLCSSSGLELATVAAVAASCRRPIVGNSLWSACPMLPPRLHHCSKSRAALSVHPDRAAVKLPRIVLHSL